MEGVCHLHVQILYLNLLQLLRVHQLHYECILQELPEVLLEGGNPFTMGTRPQIRYPPRYMPNQYLTCFLPLPFLILQDCLMNKESALVLITTIPRPPASGGL